MLCGKFFTHGFCYFRILLGKNWPVLCSKQNKSIVPINHFVEPTRLAAKARYRLWFLWTEFKLKLALGEMDLEGLWKHALRPLLLSVMCLLWCLLSFFTSMVFALLHNLSVMFWFRYLLCLLYRCFCLFDSFLHFPSFLPLPFFTYVLLTLVFKSFFSMLLYLGFWNKIEIKIK